MNKKLNYAMFKRKKSKKQKLIIFYGKIQIKLIKMLNFQKIFKDKFQIKLIKWEDIIKKRICMNILNKLILSNIQQNINK